MNDGVESFWDTNDMQIGYRKSQAIISSYDKKRFQLKPFMSFHEVIGGDIDMLATSVDVLREILEHTNKELADSHAVAKKALPDKAHIESELRVASPRGEKLQGEHDLLQSTHKSEVGFLTKELKDLSRKYEFEVMI